MCSITKKLSPPECFPRDRARDSRACFLFFYGTCFDSLDLDLSINSLRKGIDEIIVMRGIFPKWFTENFTSEFIVYVFHHAVQ